MKIEEGKFYRTREGKKIGPATWVSRTDRAERGYFTFPDSPTLWPNGFQYGRGNPVGADAVAEWAESPVRTVTRKEIVPGTYGRIDVTGTYQGNRVTLDWTGNESIHSAPAIAGLDAAELRAAAEVFTQLADALEDQK